MLLTSGRVCGHVDGVEVIATTTKPCSACAGTGQVPITLTVQAVIDAARALAEGGHPITRKAIMERTGSPKDTVYGAICELMTLGHLRRDLLANSKHGQYQYLLCTDAD